MSRVLRLITGVMLLLTGISKAATWQIELVDQTGAGKFSSLKIDKDGNAHVAYVADDGKDSLKYAFWDRAVKKWFVLPVARGASFSSLVLDSKQRPHISWADAGSIIGSKLRYAYWDGAAWINRDIPLAAETIAYYTSIALDGNDRPSISFYEVEGPRGSGFRVRMRVVTWNGTYWEVRTIDGQNQSGKFNGMAADILGHIHLAYANVNAGTPSVRYAYWDGTLWKTEVVDDRERNNMLSVGYALGIAVDKEANPHLSYMNYSTPAVKYAVRKNGRWQTQVVEQIAGVGYPDRNSITFDSQGRPYIGYYDAGRGILKVAHQEERSWITEIVDSGGCGFTSSLQIDRGTLWITYADEGRGGFKVARRQLEPPNTPAADGGVTVGRVK